MPVSGPDGPIEGAIEGPIEGPIDGPIDGPMLGPIDFFFVVVALFVGDPWALEEEEEVLPWAFRSDCSRSS
jgi:hypothetical protein